MNLFLEIDGNWKRFPAEPDSKIRLGRNPANDCCLRGIQTVSDYHAEIELQSDGWWLQAMEGSGNDTRMNGTLVPKGTSSQIDLNKGVLLFGQCRVRYAINSKLTLDSSDIVPLEVPFNPQAAQALGERLQPVTGSSAQPRTMITKGAARPISEARTVLITGKPAEPPTVTIVRPPEPTPPLNNLTTTPLKDPELPVPPVVRAARPLPLSALAGPGQRDLFNANLEPRSPLHRASPTSSQSQEDRNSEREKLLRGLSLGLAILIMLSLSAVVIGFFVGDSCQSRPPTPSLLMPAAH